MNPLFAAVNSLLDNVKADGGKILELIYTIEDAGTFTATWSGRSTYSRADAPLFEFVCAENNREQETAGSHGVTASH